MAITELTTIIPVDNIDLLTTALTHRSYLNEHKEAKIHNERLEFLGDAVLELAVSQFLFNKYPNNPEGDLTAFRAALVRTTSLADLAEKLNLGDYLLMSKGEEGSGGRKNKSLLANTVEALLGALYLDKGYPAVVTFLEEYLYPNIDEIVKQGSYKDYKSSLQEVVQSQGFESPVYEVIDEEGPDHDKTFTMRVLVDSEERGIGVGRSKQKAQQEAAKQALEKIQIN